MTADQEEQAADDFADFPGDEAEFAAAEGMFGEDAIEQAYLQALKASEEAGLLSPAPDYVGEGSIDSEWEEMLAAEAAAVAASSAERPTSPAVPPAETAPDAAASSRPQFSPQQIIEALLFVGGEKLPSKKIASLLGHQCEETSVRNWIEEINQRYTRQNRPYEIVLGENGYRMALRPTFQQQRQLLFGYGPKEVKLPQEAIEVLSFVAYRQPVMLEQILEIDRPGVQNILRQLVRRELVVLDRETDERGPVYRTTSRFLQVFGLEHLTDLPRSRDLAMK